MQSSQRQRVVLDRRQGAVDQIEHLIGVGQPAAAALDHVAGGLGQPLAPLGILPAGLVQHHEIVLGRLDGEGQARVEQLQQRHQQRLAAGVLEAGLGDRAVVLELVELHHQPLGERDRPADVGAAIGVVADPGGQREQARPQLAPVVGVELARDVEGDFVDLAHDGADLSDDLDRLGMLLGKIEPGRRPVGQALGTRQDLLALRIAVRAERGRGQHGLQLHRPPEGRVRGEHEAVVDALDPGGEHGEWLRRTIRGACQPHEQLTDALAIAGGVELTQIAARGGGSLGEGLAGQALDQCLGGMLVEHAGAQLLLEVERQQRDRIGVRIAVEPAACLGQRLMQGRDRGIGRRPGSRRNGLQGGRSGQAKGSTPGSRLAFRLRTHGDRHSPAAPSPRGRMAGWMLRRNTRSTPSGRCASRS